MKQEQTLVKVHSKCYFLLTCHQFICFFLGRGFGVVFLNVVQGVLIGTAGEWLFCTIFPLLSPLF